MFLESQFVIKADVPNANNRLYPREVLEDTVSKYQALKKGAMLGQLGMPGDSIIHLNMISHIIKDLKLTEEGELLADIELLKDTPSGKTLEKALETGQVVFRLQGVGSVRVTDDEVIVINKDYQLITINAVIEKDNNGN